MYQMKLSRSANHEPVRGYWARVCETCYKSREGYNDHDGVLVDHTRAFSDIRRKRVERQNLEMARLEKRLTRLTQLLASPPDDLPATNGIRASPVATLTGQNSSRKLLEQSVVTWEDDASVQKCPFCQQEFGSWTFRRHHCRTCGRVVCSDPQTGCSTEVPLAVSGRESPRWKPVQITVLTDHTAANSTTEKAHPNGAQLSLDIRMCRDCNRTIFAKRDFDASLVYKPPDQRAYETLQQFERGIQQLMTSFQRALLTLQAEPDGSASSALTSQSQIKEAGKIRKRLIDTFAKYDLASRRLRDLPTTSDSQLRLQKGVHAAASAFLHANMLPLKSVPQMLRRTPHLTPSTSKSSSLSPLRNGEMVSETTSQASESTVISTLETEEKDLREKLVVLEEQRFMVGQMVEAARGARRFEEVSALAGNVKELDGEIEKVRGLVGGVEERWRGVYGGASS